MRTHAKLVLTALAAALLLSITMSTASARILSITNANSNFRVMWSRLEYVTNPFITRCRVTLEGSFHGRSIFKVRGTLIGAITKASFDTANCTGGRRIPYATPWHLTYEAFEGALPNITAIDFLIGRGVGFTEEMVVIGIPTICRYGTPTDNITYRAVINAGRAVTTLNPVPGRSTYNLVEGSFGCPTTSAFFGSAPDGVVTLLNGTARITVTLI
jgi:hypothetical protein